MRFFLRGRRGWPGVGLALAAGLLVADCLFVVGPYTVPFHAGSLWPLLAGALAMYAALGVAVDLAVQLLVPTRARDAGWLRGSAILGVAAGLALASGEARSLPLLAVAALFALLALGRFTWPVAIGVTCFALYPTLGGAPAPAADPAAASPAVRADPQAPSFVIVVLDTVRADHTSAYGYERDTTPNLARLGARGVRFERAYATACWSLPSHASLFTGLYPSRHGAHNEHLALDPRHATLAETLGLHGYETANFTANAWLGHGTGMARGFQRTHESWRAYHLDLLLLAERVRAGLVAPDRDKGGADSVAAIRAWLVERDPTRPYLLFLNVFEAHAPYQHVPRSFRRRFGDPSRSLRRLEAIGTRVTTATQNGNLLSDEDATVGGDLLDGAIAAADAVLGQVLDLVGEDPIVVVVSDHGELLGEHTLFGHSNTLYEPLIRVPMVMAGGALPRGRVVPELVSLADVMPTLLHLAGIPVPDVDGTNLGPSLTEGASLDGRRVRAEQFQSTQKAGGWRHHRPADAGYLLGRKQAVVGKRLKRIIAADGSDAGFDLIADPREERPFPGSQTRLAARVPEPEAPSEPTPLDPFQKKALQLLGYLQ